MSSFLSNLRGRSRELGLLRTTWDHPEPSLAWVVGPPGSGKTALVRRAAAEVPALVHRVPPLPEPHQRQALSRALAEGGYGPEGEGGPPPSWEELFVRFLKGPEGGSPSQGRPRVLVVDDAHRWMEARARFVRPLAAILARARADRRPVHVTLVAPELPQRPLEIEDSMRVPPLHVGPLPFPAAAPLLPGSTVGERLQAWAVFGGHPGTLSRLDPGASLGTNVRRLLLEPHAPLADAPLHVLERRVQAPARYAAILAALAGGEGDWAAIHAGVPDLTASGQVAPYLKRLEEMGLVEARRSLDASPRTRSRRYRLTDPLTAFWFGQILPRRGHREGSTPEELWSRGLRPALPALIRPILGQVWRDFMIHDALQHLGSSARECGSLWGATYDIPVAGVLSSGACFYGMLTPAEGDAPLQALAALDAQLRETRYGFGRERRLRVLFLDAAPPTGLQREAARRDDTILLGPEVLDGT